MAQIYASLEFKESKLTRREQLIILEIGRDSIDTASSFVDYMQEAYGFSKSSGWYCLNRLKKTGIAEFANRVDIGKPLHLTRHGIMKLGKLEGSKARIIAEFEGAYSNALVRRIAAYPYLSSNAYSLKNKGLG